MEAFELAVKFLANILAVVLMGLVLTETVPYAMHVLHVRKKKHAKEKAVALRWMLFDHVVIFLLVAYQGTLTLLTTFSPKTILSHTTQWIPVAVFFMLFLLVLYWRAWKLLVVAGIFMVTFVLARICPQDSPLLLLSLQSIALFSFYFYIVLYSIFMRTQEYTQHVATQKLFSWRRAMVFASFVFLWVLATNFLTTRSMPTREFLETQDMQSVVVQLKWQHSSQFAGLYMAEAKDLYRNAGIRPVFVPLAVGVSPITEVAQGRARFGIAGGLDVARARSEGKPLIALAALYQRDPLVAYVLASSNLQNYEDIQTARVGASVAPRVLSRDVYEQVKRHGMNPDTLEVIYAGDNQNEALVTEVIDVAFGYETSQVDQLRRKGYDVRILKSNAPRAYGDVLFTTEAILAEYPDIVKSFVDATRMGWEMALQNREEAVDVVLSYDDGTNVAMTTKEQLAFLEAASSYLKPAPDFAIGAMDRDVWGSMIQSLYQVQLLTTLIAPEDFLYRDP